MDILVSPYLFAEIKLYRTNHFKIICQFFDPSKNLFLHMIGESSRALKEKLEKIIAWDMQCGRFPSGNRGADTAPKQAHRIARERISGGNRRSIIRPVRFSPFSSAAVYSSRALIARMNDVTPRRHCNNAVYTPKSNFVIRSVGRGRLAMQRVTRWNCYRPEVHLTFGTVTTII